MFNLKNKTCQSKFKDLTNEGTFLSEVFDNNDDINKCTTEFIKRLNKVIQSSFMKIRISDKQDKVLEELFKKNVEK